MPAALSWAALNIVAGAGVWAPAAVGRAMAPTATSPDAAAISWVRLATPLRGVVRSFLTASSEGDRGPPTGGP
ncbi:hypothetical protein GCM10009864_42920 [Streptomyces lunalinharesii]|uniref:Uncharacterized protein n=1 Tax=Streptomyces lunalinharesii TaxID=333384 RepID=A0ABN3S5E7_9ACTN